MDSGQSERGLTQWTVASLRARLTQWTVASLRARLSQWTFASLRGDSLSGQLPV